MFTVWPRPVNLAGNGRPAKFSTTEWVRSKGKAVELKSNPDANLRPRQINIKTDVSF